jgi:Fe2+ transport system protein B
MARLTGKRPNVVNYPGATKEKARRDGRAFSQC